MERNINELKPEELFNLYLEQGCKLLRCKGYIPALNPHIKTDAQKAYDTAKVAIDKDYTKEDFAGVSPEEATRWLKQGGWVGCRIPEEIIALDVDQDDFKNEYLESICAQFGIAPSIHKTPNGKHYLFQLKDDLPAATGVRTKCGTKVTYRVGGKSYLNLTPVPFREWELWQPLQELPVLPPAFYPYDRHDKTDILNCLSWKVGDARRNGLLDGWEDIDAAYMGLLFDCGISKRQIHDAFKIVFLTDYDEDWTLYHHRRTEERLKAGDPVIGAGSFIQKVKDSKLKEVEMFTKQLLEVTGVREVTEVTEVTVDNTIQPVNIDTDLIPVTEFPFHIFPDELLAVIYELSEALLVEPEFVATAMLTIVSGAIGNTIRISPTNSRPVAPLIWLIVIADSGYGKSPVMSKLLKHIYELQAEEYRNLKEAQRKYKLLESKFKKDPTTELPEEPKMKHYILQDTTVEALSNVFANDGRGVIIHQDEIASMMLGFNQYKSKGNDKQHYIELFNCQSWRIDRKTVVRFIPNTGAAIIGGIQTKVMPQIFKDGSFDDGFLPRFLLFKGKNIVKKFSTQEITEEAFSYWTGLLAWCYQISFDCDEITGFAKPRHLNLTKTAQNLYAGFHDYNHARIRFMSEKTRVIWYKLIDYYCLKFAGVLHVIKKFDEETGLEYEIEEETMLHAIQLTEYFMAQALQALKLYDKSGVVFNELEIKLIETLYELQGEVSSGKLLLSRIGEIINSKLPFTLTPEKVRSLLKKIGLITDKSTNNLSYLTWEDEKIQNLFAKITVTSVTSVTEAEHPEEVTESANVAVAVS